MENFILLYRTEKNEIKVLIISAQDFAAAFYLGNSAIGKNSRLLQITIMA